MSDMTWHQRQGAIRVLGLHRWTATDDGDQCLRCGGVWPDGDEAPRPCPGPDGDRCYCGQCDLTHGGPQCDRP